MPITVKVEYIDELAHVEEGIRAEEKTGSLFVYDKDGNLAAKFSLSEVRHWWIGSMKKPGPF
jgi:hypothetical protein